MKAGYLLFTPQRSCRSSTRKWSVKKSLFLPESLLSKTVGLCLTKEFYSLVRKRDWKQRNIMHWHYLPTFFWSNVGSKKHIHVILVINIRTTEKTHSSTLEISCKNKQCLKWQAVSINVKATADHSLKTETQTWLVLSLLQGWKLESLEIWQNFVSQAGFYRCQKSLGSEKQHPREGSSHKSLKEHKIKLHWTWQGWQRECLWNLKKKTAEAK